MALLTSPRKQTVPLATGDDRPTQRRRRDQPAHTQRVFFCSVVVENPPDGLEYPPGASPSRICHAMRLSRWHLGLQSCRTLSQCLATPSILMETLATLMNSRDQRQTLPKPYAHTPLRFHTCPPSDATSTTPSHRAMTHTLVLDHLPCMLKDPRLTNPQVRHKHRCHSQNQAPLPHCKT